MKNLRDLPFHIPFMEASYRKYAAVEQRSDFLFFMDNCFGDATAINFLDEDWEHALLFPITKKRCPTWPEMVRLKEFFWQKNDVAIQVHPTRANYINIHPYTLHLWHSREHCYDLSVVREVTSSILKEKHSSFHSFSSSYLGTRFIAIYGGSRWPTWEEVCHEKQRFFGPDCPAIQFNLDPQFDLNDNFLLTLWDATGIDLPPVRLV